MAYQEFDGELDAPAGAKSFTEFTGELDAPVTPKPGIMDRVGDAMNTVRDFATGATPKRESVLQGVQMDDPTMDPQEAERMSRRSYVDRVERDVRNIGAPSMTAAKAPLIALRDDGVLSRASDLVGSQVDSYAAGLGMKAGDALSAVGATGASTLLKNKAMNLQDRADATQASVSANASNSFEKYAPQILSVFPTMAVAAATGGLPVMFGIAEVQAYAEGRKSGLSPVESLARAVPIGAAEVIGEKLGGTGKLIDALETAAVKGLTVESLKNLGGRFLAAGAREVPSEEVTYAMQFGIDKMPGIGLKQDAGIGDFLEGAKDTAIVAAGAGGVMAGAGAGMSAMSRSTPSYDAEQLARSKGFLTSFADPQGPASLAGITPIAVQIPAQTTVPTVGAEPTSTDKPLQRNSDQSLMDRLPTEQEPVAAYMGQAGVGFQTEKEASIALTEGRKANPALDWRVDPLDSGRFRVAGYAPQGEVNEQQPTEDVRDTNAAADGTPRAGVGAVAADTGAVPGVADTEKRIALPGVKQGLGDTAAARASAQESLDRANAADPKRNPKVTLGAPDPKVEQSITESAAATAEAFGITAKIVAFEDASPDSANGFEYQGNLFLNTTGLTHNSLKTQWHETHHVLQARAEADDAAGQTNTPAQKYRDNVDDLFDTMSDAGKRSYIENFLYRDELKDLTGNARERAIQKRLSAPLTRKEMMADFVGNRATDRKFIKSLAKADPKGFQAFADKWLKIISGLIEQLRGNGKNKESAAVDRYVADLNKARMVLRDAMVELRNSGVTQAQAGESDATLQRKQGVIGEVAPNPDQEVAAEFDAMTGSEKEMATRDVARKIVQKLFDDMGLRGWAVNFSSGTFEGKENPNFVIEAADDATQAQVDEVAKAVGYVLDQKAMVSFDENNTQGANLSSFVKIELPAGTPAATVTELRKHINETAGISGDTLRDGSLVYGNFTEYSDKPLTDAQFKSALSDAITSFPSDIVLNAKEVERFESNYIEPSSREGYLEGTRYGNGNLEQAGQEQGRDGVRRGQGRDFLERLAKEAGDKLRQWIDNSASGRERVQRNRESLAKDRARADSQRSGGVQYGTAGPNSAQAVGYHFSQQPRKALSSLYYGSGLKGAEAKRLAGQGDLQKRIYFYVDNGNGVKPEAGVGGSKHVVTLNNLYDTKTDPLGILKNTKGSDVDDRLNRWERTIMQAGFDGYLADTGANQNFAVLLGDHTIQLQRRQASTIDEINDLGNFNLDFTEDYDLDFTKGVETKEASMEDFVNAKADAISESKRAMLQAELQAQQEEDRTAAEQRARASTMRSPRDITLEEMKVHGLFPERAMPFGKVNEKNGVIKIEMSSHYLRGGYHELRSSGDVWIGEVFDSFINESHPMTRDTAIQFVKSQVSRPAISNAGYDLASAYRKGTILKLAQTWRSLAKKEGMFKLPGSAKSNNFADVVREMGGMPGYKVEAYGKSPSLNLVFERTKDGKKFFADILGRPDGSVECCTMSLDGSNIGSTFYAFASEWARVNGFKFAPASTLSSSNSARRTEQATSYALKTGDTGVILPGSQNRVYGYNENPKTLEDHDMNLARLLLAGMRNAVELDPNIRKLRYDPATDKFTDTKGNDAEDKAKAFLESTDARAFGMGRTTLARAVITSHIISGDFDSSAIEAFKKPIAYQRKQGIDDALSEEWGEPGEMTPQLKAFLGNSVMVHENGTPIVMYHGTAQDITAFKPKQAGAIFLTDSPVFADEFAGFSAEWMERHADQILTPEQMEAAKAQAIKAIMADKSMKMGMRQALADEITSGKPTGEAQDALQEAVKAMMPSGPNILPLVVRVENPFDYKNASHRANLIEVVYSRAKDGLGGTIKYWGDGSEAIVLDARKNVGMSMTKGMMEEGLKEGQWSLIEEPELQAALYDLGHDGFWLVENGRRNLAVYNPTQVKSAIGNNGEYSSEDPRINYQAREVATDPKLEKWAAGIFGGYGRVSESMILSEKIPHPAMTMGKSDPFGRDQMLVMDGHALDHASKHKEEGITPAIIGKIGNALKSPRAVFFQAPGQALVMLPVNAANGMPVVVALKKDTIKGGGQQLRVTRFATAYPRSNSASYLAAEIKKGNRVWLPLEEVSRLRDLLGRHNATQGPADAGLLTQTLARPVNRDGNQAAKTFTVLSDAALVKKQAGEKDWDKAVEQVIIEDDAEKQLRGINFQRRQVVLPGESKFMAFRRIMQDQFIHLRELQTALTQRGGTVTEAQDAYGAEELMHGRTQELLIDFGRNQIEPLIEKTRKYGIELDELSLYAYAQHAKERNAYISSINTKIGDAGSGMSDMEADNIIQMVKLSGDAAKFDELHQDLMGVTSTTRRVLLDEGLITQEEYDGWENLYSNYVPLRGFENVDDTGKARPGVGRGFSITGKESVKALGRKSKAGDIIENIIRDYERAVIRSEKNAVAKTFLDLALTNPDPALWEVQPVKVNRSFNKASGLVLMSNSPDTGEDTIAIKVAGQQVRVKINDPLILRAMKMASKEETGQLERFVANNVSWYTNLLRNTLTRFNPIFGAINAVRDFQMGSVSALDELGAEGLKLYAKYYTPALAASFRQERGKADPANKAMDKWIMEMRFAGGTTGGYHMRDTSEITQDLRTLMLQSGATPHDWKEAVRGSKPYQLASAAASWLEIIGSTSEDAARASAYRAARELGRTPAQAASIAKNLTTNFNRKGEAGGLLNSLYLFFNAGVQGSTRVLQALKNPKVQAMMAGVTATAMTIALFNAGAGDDDDGEAYWDKIPDFEKERNLIFMLPPGVEMDGAAQVGKRGRYIKIPLPYGLNVFPVLGYQLADLTRNMRDPSRGVSFGKAGINMTSAVFGSINPFGGSLDPTSPVQWGAAVLPTVGDLPLQLMTGTNAFGRPIGPEKSPFDNGPDSENFSARQAGTASQYVARWLNSVTGGNEARSGMIDVMPGTLDNVVRNATGGLGVFIADTFVNLPTKVYSPVEVTNRDIPLLRNFYGAVDGVTDLGKFYDRRAEVQKEAASAKEEMKKGIDVKYDEIALERQAISRVAESYTHLMSRLRKEEIQVAADPDMTWAEKRLERSRIEKERARLASDFNTQFNEDMGAAMRRQASK